MKTSAERSRAARLRKSADLSPDDREWLASYEATRGSAASDDPSRPLTFGAPRPRSDEVPIDESEVTAPPPVPPAAAECTIPDCPACASRHVGLVCVATGQPVPPPFSAQAANALARVLLGLIAQGIKMWRPGSELTLPNDAEVERLGASLAVLVRRRAGAVTAYDDIIGTIGGVMTFAARASAAAAVGA